MPYSHQVIRYLQQNNILASQLDHALSGVKDALLNQIEMTGAGARRLLYYTSCFTDEYKDVCQQQKTEDVRFKNAVIYLLQHRNIAHQMLTLYFEGIFKDRTSEQLEYIKQKLMAVNIHIAASSLTNAGFALATASSVATGMNLSLEMSLLAGKRARQVVGAMGIYGLVQKAAESANRLHISNPVYYSALYNQELEMMYFLIEPLFERAEAFNVQWASDNKIAEIITKMIR
ncbi:hypothetical protein [Pantoea anthophila]|uniref:hypothetical protein n=1 Tax=Pantoea anthophila TaxID=470931 RepID=UPI003CE7FD90